MTAAATPTLPVRSVDSLPGPRGWPLFGSAFAFDARHAPRILEDWARRYGKVYKVNLAGRTLIVMSDHEAAMKAMRERPDAYTRARIIRPIFEELGFVGLFAAEGNEWRRQRPLVVKALDPAHLKRFFPTIVTATQRLHRRWLRHAGGPAFEVRGDLTRFTVDVICSLAFGRDVATLERDDPDSLQVHLDRIFSGLNDRIFSIFPTWRYFKRRTDRDLEHSVTVAVTAVKEYIAQARAVMQTRPELKAAPENLLQALIAATDEERLSENELVSNVLTMLLAGEDTTAGTLAWTLYLLGRNSQVQAALRRELDPVLQGGQVITEFEHMRALPYTEATLLEALRLKPVAPLLSVSPVHDTVLAGVALPARSRVVILNRLPGVDAQRFADPEAFRPERWLDKSGETGEAVETGARRVVTPFGAGARFCPGRYLAMLEAKMALAMIVSAFDVSHSGEPVEEEHNLTMRPRNLHLRLALRT